MFYKDIGNEAFIHKTKIRHWINVSGISYNCLIRHIKA